MAGKSPQGAIGGVNGSNKCGSGDIQAILRGIGEFKRCALENRELGRGLVSNSHEFRRERGFNGIKREIIAADIRIGLFAGRGAIFLGLELKTQYKTPPSDSTGLNFALSVSD